MSRPDLNIKSTSDLVSQNRTLVANSSFRGAEIGQLIAGDNLRALTYPNLEFLLNEVRSGECDAAITDYTYIHQYFQQHPEFAEGLSVFEVTAEDFQKLLASRTHNDREAVTFLAMQEDYGGLAYEQYAVAVSSVEVLFSKYGSKSLKQHSRKMFEFEFD